MKKLYAILFLTGFSLAAIATDYPVNVKVLKNGLKVIVCEMRGSGFAQTQVWYRVGSKDETDGIHGIAHMFEHMMFRGTKKYPGSLMKRFEKMGIAEYNGGTSFDMTSYYEYTPVSMLDTIFDMEADRMANLVVDQELLNTERQVVAEEYRMYSNMWYNKMSDQRYKLLYPQSHPYRVNVIGVMDDILGFTSDECMSFYNNFYSPNNAFLTVVGDVKSDSIFALAEKYFGTVTKQLSLTKRTDVPDLFTNKVVQNEMRIDFPVQIYSFIFPNPEAAAPEMNAFNMLVALLFNDPNSILNDRIVKKEKIAYGLNARAGYEQLYSSYGILDVFMSPMPGNVKVKKAIIEEINKVIGEGIGQERIDKYIKAYESAYLLQEYSPNSIASRLGVAEYYFHDPAYATKHIEELKKIKPDDIKNVAAKYLSEAVLQFMNIKPSE